MIRKLLCLIGYHTWVYKYSQFEDSKIGTAQWAYYMNSNKLPDFARCKHCNIRYKN